MSQTPSEELMASLTPGIPLMAQVGFLGRVLGGTRGQWGVNDGVLSAFVYFLFEVSKFMI